jgi:cytochrome P450
MTSQPQSFGSLSLQTTARMIGMCWRSGLMNCQASNEHIIKGLIEPKSLRDLLAELEEEYQQRNKRMQAMLDTLIKPKRHLRLVNANPPQA